MPTSLQKHSGSDVETRTFTLSQYKRSHTQNKQQCHNRLSVTPRGCPVFCVVAYRLAVLHLMNRVSGIDFEHRHQSNSNLFYLFKHVSQYNGASPKIRSPNRGKNWLSSRITVAANLVFRRKIWGARDNGIPPRSTPDK